MATHTNYNEYGEMMIDNRSIMEQLDKEEFTKAEWATYLSICDDIASTTYKYLSPTESGTFAEFRSALHRLFTFVGCDTRILSLDAYCAQFFRVIPYKVIKSKKYRDAEKEERTFKKAIEWACYVSGADINNPESVLFPKAVDSATMQTEYFSADTQDYYNAIIKFFVASVDQNHTNLQLNVLNAELERLKEVKKAIGKEAWQCYKDYKNPMTNTRGKDLKHAPDSTRKDIEDAMADLLGARNSMTDEQLEKEDAQIQGGRKQDKKIKEAKKVEAEAK